MDFTQSMDNGYMIPSSVAVGSGEATDIRCVCDTVEDFKAFLDATGMELRYEGLVTYEKVNKLLKVYKGNNVWQTVGEGGVNVDTSNFITLTQLSQQLNNYYTKAQADEKILEEVNKIQLNGVAPSSSSILKNMKWCVIGDSISDTVEGRGRTTKFYQEYIQDETGCHLFNWGGNGTGYVKEFNGVNCISNRLNDIPDDSNLITIFAGTNDNVNLGSLGDITTSTFYGAVELTVKSIIEKYPLIPLGLITPLPSGSSFNGKGKLVGYSKAIKEIGEKYSVPVLDLFSCSGFRLGQDDFVLNNIPDRLHPNANGHKILSKKIKPWLENMVLVDQISDVTIRGVVVFPQEQITYAPGETVQLQVSLSRTPNENQGVVLTSSNSSVKISPSTIYFNKNNDIQTVSVSIPSDVSGKFTITGNTWQIVSSIDFIDSGASEDIPVNSVSLDKTSHTMAKGETLKLTPTIEPSNATNTNVVWEASNNNCTVVNGLVTAIEEGECVITCKTVDGNKTDSCNIVIESKSNDDTLSDYLINLDFNDNSDKRIIKDLAHEGRTGSVNSTSLVSWEDGVMKHVCTAPNQGLTVADINTSGVEELSFEMSIQSDISGNATILYSAGMAGDNISMSLTDTGVSCSMRAYDDGANTWLPSINANIDTTQKTHIVLSMASGNISLYINGVAAKNATNTFKNLSIKTLQAINWQYKGFIDRLNVYSKALTQNEVEDIYDKWNNN